MLRDHSMTPSQWGELDADERHFLEHAWNEEQARLEKQHAAVDDGV